MWIGENEICFRTAPNLYKTETSKVMFVGSFLDGDAKSWFTDYFKDPARILAFMDDWNLFTIELQRNFGLEDEIGAAEEELRKLSMNDQDHATYFTARFQAVVSNLQDTWNDQTLRNQYYSKIAPHLRIQFVSSGTPVPATLEPLISTTERFDRAYWANLELDRAMNAQNSASRDKTKNKTGTHKNELKVTPKTEPTTPKNTTPARSRTAVSTARASSPTPNDNAEWDWEPVYTVARSATSPKNVPRRQEPRPNRPLLPQGPLHRSNSRPEQQSP